MGTKFLFIFIGYGLLSYFIGYHFQNNKIAKLKNIFIDHAIILAILIFLLGLFGTTDTNTKQAAFTFSSVYFGFWLGIELKKRDEVKTLKYYLGLIWEEQRFNLHQYQVIESNYSFLFDSIERIPLNAIKMGTIYSLAGLLKTEAHNAYISSGAVTTLTSVALPIKEKDELFNTIEIAYNNVEHFKSFLFTVSTDFKNKASLGRIILDSPFAEGASGDMEAKVTDAAKELMIAKRSSLKARDDVDLVLNKLNVNQNTEELREDTLTAEDKKFIAGVIRKKPIDPNEIFRRPANNKTNF